MPSEHQTNDFSNQPEGFDAGEQTQHRPAISLRPLPDELSKRGISYSVRGKGVWFTSPRTSPNKRRHPWHWSRLYEQHALPRPRPLPPSVAVSTAIWGALAIVVVVVLIAWMLSG